MSSSILKNISDTKAFADSFATTLKPPCVIGLIGDLGAGKTTLTKFILSALGCKEEVTSPTFVLQHIYRSSKGNVSHWDLYRLKNIPEELYEDLQGDNIVLIEWVDKFPELVERCDYLIDIRLVEAGQDGGFNRLLKLTK